MRHDFFMTMWQLMVVGFALCWPVNNFMMSRFGWSRLVEAHPGGPLPPHGLSFRGRNGRIGSWISYNNNCLNITLSGEGIYVAPRRMARLFHPPLLLPWAGVRSIEEKRALFWRLTHLVFEEFNGPRFTLYLPSGVLADIRTMSGGRNFS